MLQRERARARFVLRDQLPPGQDQLLERGLEVCQSGPGPPSGTAPAAPPRAQAAVGGLSQPQVGSCSQQGPCPSPQATLWAAQRTLRCNSGAAPSRANAACATAAGSNQAWPAETGAAGPAQRALAQHAWPIARAQPALPSHSSTPRWPHCDLQGIRTPTLQQRRCSQRANAGHGVCRRGDRCCRRPMQPRRCWADPPLLPGADQGGQLQQLTGVVQALVLPRLSLADLQSLGQACAATRATVRGLPYAQLRQLAQVRSCWVPGAAKMASSDTAGRAHRHTSCR